MVGFKFYSEKENWLRGRLRGRRYLQTSQFYLYFRAKNAQKFYIITKKWPTKIIDVIGWVCYCRKVCKESKVIRVQRRNMPSPRSQWRKYEWEREKAPFYARWGHIYSMGTVYFYPSMTSYVMNHIKWCHIIWLIYFSVHKIYRKQIKEVTWKSDFTLKKVVRHLEDISWWSSLTFLGTPKSMTTSEDFSSDILNTLNKLKESTSRYENKNALLCH